MTTPHHPEIKLEMDISLDTLIGAEVTQGEDGPEYNGGFRLGDLVADLLAVRLAEQAGRQARDAMGYGEIRARIESAIDRLVEAKLDDLIEREVMPTDGFGKPTGEPTTLAEQIMKQAAAWFSKPASDRVPGTRQTNLEALVAKVVDRRVTDELKKVVQQAVADAKEQVQAVIARMFADEAAKAVSRR